MINAQFNFAVGSVQTKCTKRAIFVHRWNCLQCYLCYICQLNLCKWKSAQTLRADWRRSQNFSPRRKPPCRGRGTAKI